MFIRKRSFSFFLLLLSVLTITIPQHVYVKVAISLFVLIALWSKYYDNTTIQLLFFSISYSLIAWLVGCDVSNFELLSYIVAPIAFYMIGKQLVDVSNKGDDNAISYLFIVIAGSVALWYINVSDGIENGFINTTRLLYNEDNKLMLTATIQGVIASLGISMVAYLVSYGVKFNIKSAVCLACVLLSTFCVIHLVNRTGLVVLGATICATLAYTSKTKFSRVVIFILFLVSLYYLLVLIGVLNEDLYNAYEERNLDDVGKVSTAGSRTERWIQSISLLFTSPIGWYNMSRVEYSHNLWLDVARVSGWLPFGILLSITIKQIKSLVTLFKINGDKFIGFLFGVMSCVYLSAFVEPIIEGISTYFAIMCLLWGMQNAYYRQYSIMRSITNKKQI